MATFYLSIYSTESNHIMIFQFGITVQTQSKSYRCGNQGLDTAKSGTLKWPSAKFSQSVSVQRVTPGSSHFKKVFEFHYSLTLNKGNYFWNDRTIQ